MKEDSDSDTSKYSRLTTQGFVVSVASCVLCSEVPLQLLRIHRFIVCRRNKARFVGPRTSASHPDQIYTLVRSLMLCLSGQIKYVFSVRAKASHTVAVIFRTVRVLVFLLSTPFRFAARELSGAASQDRVETNDPGSRGT